MKTLLVCSTLALGTAQAATLFDESFEYGGSDIDPIDTLANYSANTGVIEYDADISLTHSGMNESTGGSIFYNFASAGTRSAENTDPNFGYTSAGAGDTFWLAGLIQYNNAVPSGEDPLTITFQAGVVNDWGFGIDDGGNVLLIGSDDGGATAGHDTGADIVADGSTYLFLSRATLGSGTSPSNSTIDFWFNPSDTSSVAALGAVTFSTGADSKIGRDSETYSSLNFALGGSPGVRADEFSFGDDLVDVVGVPEPGTLALVGIALGALAVIRRRG